MAKVILVWKIKDDFRHLANLCFMVFAIKNKVANSPTVIGISSVNFPCKSESAFIFKSVSIYHVCQPISSSDKIVKIVMTRELYEVLFTDTLLDKILNPAKSKVSIMYG